MSYLEFVRNGQVVLTMPLDGPVDIADATYHHLIQHAAQRLPSLEGVSIRVQPGKAAEEPAVVLDPDGPPQLQGYDIGKKLGQGGMGSVWLATQHGTNREVAIKTLTTSDLDDEQIARFALEIEVTAQLDHPNIGRLYESKLQKGMCYYAMEFINGSEMEDWAEATKPNLNTWLGMMVKVCRAVQYAHQKGIIHRDLKPTNIMVLEGGEPKVVDFGIAKLVEKDKPETPEDTKLTREGTYLGTPAYMSPEQIQARPEDIDTRTDVYALGVILYEHIVGTHPHGDLSNTMTLFITVVRQDAKPPRQVNPSVARDLEAVLIKALAKDPNQRYTTAAELADELQRFLDGEPVLAQPQTAMYLARKKLWKHKGKFVLTAAMLATIGAYGVFSFFLIRSERDAARDARVVAEAEREKAENRFNAGRDFARSLIFNLDEKLEEGVTAVRAELVVQSSGYLDNLRRDSGDRPDVLLDIASAYIKVGEVQQAKGDREAAMKTWTVAQEAFTELKGNDKADQDIVERGIADAAIHLAQGLRAGNEFKKSKAMSETAIEVLEPRKKDKIARALLAQAYEDYGKLLRQTGDTPGASKRYRQALKIREKQLKKKPEDITAMSSLASVNYALGNLRLDQGRTQKAKAAFQRSLDLRKQLLAKSPKNLAYQRRLASGHRGMGFAYQARGELDRAEASFKRAFEVYKEQSKADPDNQGLKVNVLWSYVYIGDVAIAQHHLLDARRALGSGLELASKLVEADPDNIRVRRILARLLTMVADVDLLEKRFNEATQLYEQALETTGPMLETNAKDLYALDPHSTAMMGLGKALHRRGDINGAWKQCEAALKLKRELVKGSPKDKSYKEALGLGLVEVGSLARARKLENLATKHLGEAESIFRGLLKTDSTNGVAQRGLMLALVDAGESAQKLAAELSGDARKKKNTYACTAFSDANVALQSFEAQGRKDDEFVDRRKRIDAGLKRCK